MSFRHNLSFYRREAKGTPECEVWDSPLRTLVSRWRLAPDSAARFPQPLWQDYSGLGFPSEHRPNQKSFSTADFSHLTLRFHVWAVSGVQSSSALASLRKRYRKTLRCQLVAASKEHRLRTQDATVLGPHVKTSHIFEILTSLGGRWWSKQENFVSVLKTFPCVSYI